MNVLGQVGSGCRQAGLQDVDDDLENRAGAEGPPVTAENLERVQDEVLLRDFFRTGEVSGLHVHNGVDRHGPEFARENLVQLEPEPFVQF